MIIDFRLDDQMTQKNKHVGNTKKPKGQKTLSGVPDKSKGGVENKASLKTSFPIVGIGASAGGLEALESFLANVPENSGMAFVIVQHLDPTHKGIMVELLQRATAMKVIQVKDRTRVKPDCVYVIPPNKDMSILHGVLHLLDPVAPRGLRLPIDFFFRSLADDQQEHSIGVILSGMGSDGTLGLRAIKEKAGVVFVQEPASAKFDGMPRSAIDAGLADVIAPVEELPGKIIAFLQHVPLIAKPGLAVKDKAQSGLEKVVILLRSQTGHDFSLYKNTTLYRRIERRMGIHQIDRIATYVRFLQENPQEVELLFRELLIGVTSFFRDPEAWEQLKAEVIPALLAEGASEPGAAGLGAGLLHRRGSLFPGHRLQRSAGSENLQTSQEHHLQIFATDLDQHAIEKARAGVVSGQHRRGRVGGAAGPVLRQGGERLSGGEIHPGDGHLCPAEHHHGPALHQARPAELPQPADLPDAGVAEEAPAALSLQPEPGRLPVFGERGDHWQLYQPVRAAGGQNTALPAAGFGPDYRTGRIPDSFYRPPIRARQQNR